MLPCLGKVCKTECTFLKDNEKNWFRHCPKKWTINCIRYNERLINIRKGSSWNNMLWFNFTIRPTVLLIFVVREQVWFFQVRFSSINYPRYEMFFLTLFFFFLSSKGHVLRATVRKYRPSSGKCWKIDSLHFLPINSY